MDSLNPEVMFRQDMDIHLGHLSYQPSTIEVVEIGLAKDAMVSVKRRSIEEETELRKWLDEIPQTSPKSELSIEGPKVLLLLGKSSVNSTSRIRASTFWPGSRSSPFRWPISIPLSRDTFETVINKFSLPKSTPSLCLAGAAHFQRYILEASDSGSPRIGFTMRRPNGGLFAMDVALSLSHDTSSCFTFGLLFTTSSDQLEFMLHHIRKLGMLLVFHPLLLPTLLCTYAMTTLTSFTMDRWSEYLSAEMASGQSVADPFGSGDRHEQAPLRHEDFNDLTKAILRIVQLATSYDNYFQACFEAIESIQESIEYVSSAVPEHRKDVSRKVGAILDERLRYISHEGRNVFCELQSLKERTGVQMNAIFNFIAQRDNKLSQSVGADSREIAAATKVDSTAMKGLAVVAMLFLPGTFFATFFAMPFFDWTDSQIRHVISHHLWVYWVVTIPTTLAVFATYAIWFRYAVSQGRRAL